MKRIKLTLLLCIIALTNVSGQTITINYDIDTTAFDISEPLNLWLDFLKTKNDSIGSKYWNKAEVEKYGYDSYFLIENELQFGSDNYLLVLSYADVKILSIRKVDEFYKITCILEFKPYNGKGNIQYIFHVYAGPDSGKLKLYNALTINTRLNLNHSTVGMIRFHYPKAHSFNSGLAKEQNDFLQGIATDFRVPIDTMDYYFAPTFPDVQRIKGFDFIVGDNGEEVPSGKADPKNRIVYSAGLAEYYPHEFIHILLNPHYPDCHLWFNEGVATFFGMSRGKDVDWHLRKVNTHLIEHPEIDLNNMLELRTLDKYTGYRYALGGFLIGEAFKKGGYGLVMELMKAGQADEDFYAAIEKFLGVQRQDIDHWIREKLKTTYGTQ